MAILQKIYLFDGIAKVFVNLENGLITSGIIESLNNQKRSEFDSANYENNEDLISNLLWVFTEEFTPKPPQDNEKLIQQWNDAWDSEMIPFVDKITQDLFGLDASEIF
ncbi:MAG: hypothetical protein HC836_31085 [Richelia sp. RM2_1_2]|nr:hypothetical protein [Richelia sp. RM2_1_2]